MSAKNHKGAQIGDVHTFEDWGLYLIERTITLPELRTNYITVPGRDGLLDLSEALTGEMHYDNRAVTLTLGTFETLTGVAWADLLADVSNYVHGQRRTITLDEDPDYHYTGRGKVDGFEWDHHGRQQFVLSFDCDPFRVRNEKTIVTQDLTTTDTAITLVNNGRAVVPTISNTAEAVLTWQGASVALSAGTHAVTGIRLPAGSSTLTARTTSGAGTLTVRWNEVTL